MLGGCVSISQLGRVLVANIDACGVGIDIIALSAWASFSDQVRTVLMMSGMACRFIWIARGLSLSRRVRHLEERWAYYLAFGASILPSTFSTTNDVNLLSLCRTSLGRTMHLGEHTR